MTESKLLEVDKDEWFYQSMKKYTHLYMFELEVPLDALEVINETSLCVSGLQAYSKRCEILQLCVPPKLLRPEDEEGLCKDRDFKILSGGYAQGRIKEIKSIARHSRLVATVQEEYNGVIIHEVGDDSRATILESCRLSTGNSTSMINFKSLCCMNDRIIVASKSGNIPTQPGIILHEWKTEGNDSYSSCSSSTSTYPLWSIRSELKCGNIVKTKQWVPNTCIFLTDCGTTALYDFRTGDNKPGLFFHAMKSPNREQDETMSSSSSPVVFTFDSIPQLSKIGVLDSCGGYETFDSRFVGPSGSTSASPMEASSSSGRGRSLLPEFSDLAGVYPDWFNIEYEPWTKMRENVSSRFFISGVKREQVTVFQESSSSNSNLETDKEKEKDPVQSVFSHDGHTKPVTHSIWHPVADNLVFSASADAVLHAWQFIQNEEEK